MGIERLPRTIELDATGSFATIINQTKLPYEVEYLTISDWQRMVEAIQHLEVRGAPALGIAGAAALCLFVHHEWQPGSNCFKALSKTAKCIAHARPTAVNLSWGVKRVEQAIKNAILNHSSTKGVSSTLSKFTLNDFEKAKQAARNEVQTLILEDEATCREIGETGSSLFFSPVSILTHCNAGSLATAFYGTALGVVYSAFDKGLIKRVYADETRPVNQGARLTAWELTQAGVPTTLICDNMAASLMQKKEIDAVIVGADRICANGDTANKIGTYALAVLAQHHRIPFYVAAPLCTIDWTLLEGSAIEIEIRSEDEVLPRPISGVEVYNPAFDVTPAHLISAFITEIGLIRPYDFPRLKQTLEK